MRYAWAIILVIVDLVWIGFTIYDFVYSAKCTGEYIKDSCRYENVSLFDWLGDFFTRVEGVSIWCIPTNLLVLFIYSLLLYLHTLE